VRILVYLHRLTIGGIQINAIDLATAIRDLGHEVVLASTPGPLESVLEDRGLTFVPTPIRGHFRPSPDAVRGISSIVRRQEIELVHAHSPFASLEAFYGAHVRARAPLVASYMGMTYPRYLPKTIPLVVGTREVEASARKARSGPVVLIEPPVDTTANHPSVDGLGFRRSCGLRDDDLAIVIVSRLAIHMKLESLLSAIDVTGSLAEELPVRLVVVGDGKALPILRERADAAGRRLGRSVVTFTGHMVDPGPAYAAADVVVGMGSSILRGMAFGKPAVVIAESGFSEIVAPETLPWFRQHGFYGVGTGSESPTTLFLLLRDLLKDDGRRGDLGRFSRSVVCEQFSLSSAALTLQKLYERSVLEDAPTWRLSRDAAGTTARVMAHKVRRLGKIAIRSSRSVQPVEACSAVLNESGDVP
jgi:glycosyltransferase involved in cell wall biosynthesis